MGISSQIDRYEVHYVSRSYNNNQKPDRGNRGNHAKAPSRLLRKKRLRLPHQQARTGRTLVQRRRKRRKRGSRPLPDRLEGRLLQFLRRIRILEAKNLGEGYSLCIANLALLVHPGKTFTLHQTRKLTFIFRRLRDKNTDESTWEIIHLRRCYTCPQDSTGKLPEISCSLDNLRYLNRFTTGDLSLDETRSLYALLQEKSSATSRRKRKTC